LKTKINFQWNNQRLTADLIVGVRQRLVKTGSEIYEEIEIVDTKLENIKPVAAALISISAIYGILI
jgi:hypothetical protein